MHPLCWYCEQSPGNPFREGYAVRDDIRGVTIEALNCNGQRAMVTEPQDLKSHFGREMSGLVNLT